MTEDEKKRVHARFHELWDEAKQRTRYDVAEWDELQVHLRAALAAGDEPTQEKVIRVATSLHTAAEVAEELPKTAAPITLRLTHIGGSSRPCEVVGVETKPVRGKRTVKTTIRVRWGSSGLYDVDPVTGKVAKIEWSAEPAACRDVIEAWKVAHP